MSSDNTDFKTIESFGREWSRFDQAALAVDEAERLFAQYFSIFPWDLLPSDGGVGADVGCGSGRWAKFVAPRVRRLHVVDASANALDVARRNLAGLGSVEYHAADVAALPFARESLDFAYSLGVLHHTPDTAFGVRAIAAALKPGAPLLLYLYYALDNRPGYYRALWKISDLARKIVSKLPSWAKFAVADIVAALVYWPLARAGRLLESADLLPNSWPLAFYRNCPFYVMRTDALDRLGTPLEKRFTRAEIERMLTGAGFTGVRFSETPPFWCAVGIKTRKTSLENGCREPSAS